MGSLFRRVASPSVRFTEFVSKLTPPRPYLLCFQLCNQTLLAILYLGELRNETYSSEREGRERCVVALDLDFSRLLIFPLLPFFLFLKTFHFTMTFSLDTKQPTHTLVTLHENTRNWVLFSFAQTSFRPPNHHHRLLPTSPSQA